MVSDPRDEQQLQRAFTAAHLYYVQNRTMDAVAHELATSRSTVSRLLSLARSSGIVDIRITSPREAPAQLEARLGEVYGIRASVVPVPPDISEEERLERVAMAAAHDFHDMVAPGMTVGVAWGSTIAALSRHLVPRHVPDTVFVQLNGSGNTRTTGLVYATEILHRFGAAYGGAVEQFPVPTFFDDPATKRAMWRERSTRRILDVQRRMDLVAFSVGSAGSPVPSHVYSGGYLERADLEALRADRVVGDVATVFYRADGSSDGIALNDRATGPAFEDLRRAPRRVCVVSGVSKLVSLRGALAARLVTDLVIDEVAARSLVPEDTE
ncbi:sugar-binding transcriptional regulator [Microbacterium aureliae]